MRYPLLLTFIACFLNSGTAVCQQLDPRSFHTVRSGLNNSYQVFSSTGKGRVAFMGGSITEGPGWRDQVVAFLQEMFPKTTFEFINAGISSTGSTPGAFRLSKDVFSFGKIDLLFEEAAVNDPTNGFYGKYQIRGMEGIVRQALASNRQMDIILLHFADPEKLKSFSNGLEPEVITQHEKVASHYGVNTINLAKEVYQRINNGEFSWERDFKDLHPSPFGHALYAKSINTFLKNEREYPSPDDIRKMPQPLDKFSYYEGHYASITKAEIIRGFNIISDWVPRDSVATRKQYIHVPVLSGNKIGDELTFSFEGKAIGICITSGPDAGTIEYMIDENRKGKIDLYTQWSGQLHLPWYLMLEDELPEGSHQATIRISSSKHPQSLGHAVRIQHFLINGK
jgi:sialidase-1